MLRRIHGVRVSFKTGLIVIILAVIMWGFVTWARIGDFVPEELKEPHPAPPVQVP